MGKNKSTTPKREVKKEWADAKKSVPELNKLDEKDLQDSFLYLCQIEYANFQRINELHQKNNELSRLKRRLERAAELKGKVLLYPDQIKPKDGMAHYFEAERRTKELTVTALPKAVISADSKVEG
jgi:hypothetical protein